MTCWLFVPGHDTRKIARAMSSSASLLILDWEDAVPAATKTVARETTLRALRALPTRPVVIRVSAACSIEHAADVAALQELRGQGLAGVMVAKAEQPSDLEGIPKRFRTVPLVESAIGLTNRSEFSRAHPRVWRLAFGAPDYLVDVRGT